MTACDRQLAQLLDELLLRLAGGLEVLLERHALRGEPHAEVLQAVLDLASTSGSGASSSTSSASAIAALSRSAICACSLRTPRDARREVGPQLVDRVELGHLVGPLVGDLGEHLLLDVLHDHPELHGLFVRVAGCAVES